MYPYLRLGRILLNAYRKPTMTMMDESVLHYRARLFDFDLFGELNNGRHLTMMDLGRFDLSVRSGFWKIVRERGWVFVVAGASVRYRRRVPAFSRFSLHTKLLCADERWAYFHQQIKRGDVVCSEALMRTGILAKGKALPMDEISAAIGEQGIPRELPEWVKAWSEADELRPLAQASSRP